MYIEKRKAGKSIKYYLVHSYRDNGAVQKIRRYLGKDLSSEELKHKRESTEKIILDLVAEVTIDIFSFKLTKTQLEKLNNYAKRIKIIHLTKEEWKQFTQEFVYNTNAIEGSTVTSDEVPLILSKDKPSGHEEMETRGVARAVEYIQNTKEYLSLELLLKLHKLCFERTKPFAGKFREVNVGVVNSLGQVVHSGVPKEQLKDYLKDFIDWYQTHKNRFNPLALAAIIHNQFENIHPFQDGNGRVGRLLLNYILIKNNYPPINILLEDRQEYYHTLQEYSKKDNLRPTMEFLIRQYKKTLKKVTTKNR